MYYIKHGLKLGYGTNSNLLTRCRKPGTRMTISSCMYKVKLVLLSRTLPLRNGLCCHTYICCQSNFYCQSYFCCQSHFCCRGLYHRDRQRCFHSVSNPRTTTNSVSIELALFRHHPLRRTAGRRLRASLFTARFGGKFPTVWWRRRPLYIRAGKTTAA
jgi:hypothetical protein